MKYLNKRSYILLFLTVLLLSSCVPEKRLARNFIDNPPSNKFLIITPDFVLKESLKPLSDTTLEDVSQRKKDSLAFLESEFVQNIPDEMFFSLYLPAMNEELDSLGLNVTFNKPPREFFSDTTSNAYIFEIAQIQLQEYSEKIYDYDIIGRETYYKRHTIDGILLNAWVELQRVNASDNKPVLLFAELSKTDKIDGYFHQNQLTGKVKYSYKRDDLSVSEVKEMIRKAGRIHARYMFDFLMNQYIKAKMRNDEMKPRYYLHYNRFENTLEFAEDDRFTRQR
ncbi:MAG: hypothetical protein K9I29_03895 [Bacteroidales bacterium]|nr:hypothetical protein [Bacteroidales bacterium]MCF8327415.1 hypothetical protein [Bacteroidales bacterium]